MYEYKNPYILDFRNIQYYGEVHKIIKDVMDFPDYYGENWSAFWDLLWSECDADQVIIKGEYSLSKEFDKSLSKMHEALEDNRKFREENALAPFSYKIIN